MQELEKILEEIDRKIAKVESIPISEDEFAADGEEIYDNGKTQGRYEELIWCRNIIRKHLSRENGQEITRLSRDNAGWIPVEERLPEDGETVLCTDGEYVYLVEYDADLDAPFGDMDGITDWQSSPEPPERSEEE